MSGRSFAEAVTNALSVERAGRSRRGVRPARSFGEVHPAAEQPRGRVAGETTPLITMNFLGGEATPRPRRTPSSTRRNRWARTLSTVLLRTPLSRLWWFVDDGGGCSLSSGRDRLTHPWRVPPHLRVAEAGTIAPTERAPVADDAREVPWSSTWSTMSVESMTAEN